LRLEFSPNGRRASAANHFQQQCRWGSFFLSISIGAVFATVSASRMISLCQQILTRSLNRLGLNPIIIVLNNDSQPKCAKCVAAKTADHA
jgi:hypothetical protein